MLTEKEKLEEELKLLEESLHLEVITKEEYEEAKQRVERKLKALEKKEKPQTKSEKTQEVKMKEIKEEEVREVTEAKEEPKVKSAEEIAAEYVRKASDEREAKEAVEEWKVAEAPKEEAAQIYEEKPLEKEPETAKPEEELEIKLSKGAIKALMYFVVIVLLAFGSYYFFFSGNAEDNKLSDSTVFIACSSDKDCKKDRFIVTCNNPGTKDAECAYVEDVQVKLIVLNSNNCFNCDTGRVLSILNGFFPNLDIENLGIESGEGKETSAKLGINALPAYILNSSLQQASNYHKFFNAFNKIGDSFVMKDTVSNANYYLEREEIPGKLDLIVMQNQAASTEAEKNLQEFMEAFESKVNFEKHDGNSILTKDLGINTFPVFLVNNKIKFSGVQAADVIKDNFCRMNELQECNKELSRSLV